MSNIPQVDGVYFTAKHTVLIQAKTEAETTIGMNLKAGVKYTLLSSTLGAGEEIVGEVYDPSRSVWQPWHHQGYEVKLVQKHEQMLLSDVSSFVRFVKSSTSQPVGLTLLYA